MSLVFSKNLYLFLSLDIFFIFILFFLFFGSIQFNKFYKSAINFLCFCTTTTSKVKEYRNNNKKRKPKIKIYIKEGKKKKTSCNFSFLLFHMPFSIYFILTMHIDNHEQWFEI